MRSGVLLGKDTRNIKIYLRRVQKSKLFCPTPCYHTTILAPAEVFAIAARFHHYHCQDNNSDDDIVCAESAKAAPGAITIGHMMAEGYNTSMNITVFGATGHVGSLVVEKLLAGGHNVSAFTHGAHHFEDTTRLRIIPGDIHKPEDVEKALHDSEAIISCLGSWHTPTKDILTAAMTSIVPIAEKQGIKRIISLTGSAACAPGDHLGIIDRLNRSMLSFIAPKILKDGEAHIRLLAESTLEWTVIRSPVMTNGDDTNYRLDMNSPSPFATIPRAAVVVALVDSLEDTLFIGAAPYIHQ